MLKYELMRKLMVELLRKFENSGIKIALVNSIALTLIFCGVEGPL